MKKLLTFTVFTIFLFSLSCTEDVVITVDTSKVTLYSGEEHLIEAISNFPITYLSGNEDVATVSESGLIKAINAGVTIINVISSDVTNMISVEVLSKLTLDTSKVTLYSGEKRQIEAISDFPITYLSDNEYVTTVSESGLIKAQKVGKTTINVSCEDVTEMINVEVEAQSILYPEPIMEWERTRQSIISEMGEPDYVNTSVIGYSSYSPNAPMLMYMFDDNDQLKSSSVLVKTIFSSELAEFLLERYVYAFQDEGVFYYVNGLNLEQSSMSIASTLYNIDYWMVIYIPVEGSGKKSLGKNVLQNVIETFKDLEKSFQ